MKWKVTILVGILLFAGLSASGYVLYQKQQVEHTMVDGDVERLERILNRPLVSVDDRWMSEAVERFDVNTAIVLYEQGGKLSDEQWVYLADLMTFEQFQRTVEAGAPLNVALPSQTLFEGLYSLNDEPEKWQLAHERIDSSFLNEHPNVLVRAIHDGNSEAFIDLINRMDEAAIPFDTVEQLTMEQDQQLMLEALKQKGYGSN